MIRAVLLDFDGTLVDTERLQWLAYSRALAPFGVTVGLEEYRRHFIRAAGGSDWACRRYALPVAPDDLREHACLTYAYASGGNLWPFAGADGHVRKIEVESGTHANNGAMLAALAVAGAGITLAPDFIVAPDVRAGRLVPLLAGYASPAIPINAVYPSRRHLSAKVRTFVDYLVSRFADAPAWRIDAPARA